MLTAAPSTLVSAQLNTGFTHSLCMQCALSIRALLQVDSVVALDLKSLEIDPSEGSHSRQWENHVTTQPLLSTYYVLALRVLHCALAMLSGSSVISQGDGDGKRGRCLSGHRVGNGEPLA